MKGFRWTMRIVDGPASEPWCKIGDLLVAVRTPRSSDFVTVEVGPLSSSYFHPHSSDEVVTASTPEPWMLESFSTQIELGARVPFSMGESGYELTLSSLEPAAEGPPWMACEFVLELHQEEPAMGSSLWGSADNVARSTGG